MSLETSFGDPFLGRADATVIPGSGDLLVAGAGAGVGWFPDRPDRLEAMKGTTRRRMFCAALLALLVAGCATRPLPGEGDILPGPPVAEGAGNPRDGRS